MTKKRRRRVLVMENQNAPYFKVWRSLRTLIWGSGPRTAAKRRGDGPRWLTHRGAGKGRRRTTVRRRR